MYYVATNKTLSDSLASMQTWSIDNIQWKGILTNQDGL